ncbi:MAG: Prefoldin subunit beta [Methanomassiliicoccales archaeon PtaU1.Bin124]|nr:MAG: Prefoldin subunit beta [Methanomassiliicoccales archaeon PtaU1.Bin124]
MDEISPKLQNQIAQFQQLQQQLQNVLQQKFRMEAQLKELEVTIEELKKAGAETPIYKNVGSLMIAVKDKDALLKEIEDDKETTEIRVKTLDRQEKMFREKYQVMQDQISKALGQESAPSGDDEN